MEERSRKLGWIPDLPDPRDRVYSVSSLAALPLPPKVSLRSKCHPVVDQGSIGSCVGNAVASAHVFDQMKQKAPHYFYPSRLQIYYNARAIEGTISVDAGCMIRDAVKCTVKQGVCPETMWGYNVSKFRIRPPLVARNEAMRHQILNYSRLSGAYQYKNCLASGYPFVFGFSVYSSFESYTVTKTGKVPLPKPSDSFLGGHAVMAVGYDDSTKCYECMNSWSANWGDKGYFYLPYAYVENPNLADDFWVINYVEV